ncbi:MAG TPA: hypothetical protein DDW84_06550 [Phycisphaerales bacterium]|nr:MAG: hypothetical protein A2Y13_01400 [Planctomycetes bacterium GWC2_45_44]HBG78487.1 hypothetical protein [Phycisphaerales bacterium]HBR19956.1 hypothetical protein [Phycisphaerales bacterium]
MKIEKVVVIMLLTLCGTALADKITVIVSDGRVDTRDEFNMSAAARASYYAYGKNIASAAGNRNNGDIVLGFVDGTAAVAKYYALDTIITSGTVGDGSSLLGSTIRPNGELYFGSMSGWVYARDNTNVTAAPPGYALPADRQFATGANTYMYPTSSPLLSDEIIITQNDTGKIFLRQGNNMAEAPAGYLNDGIEFGTTIFSQLGLSQGYIMFATNDGRVFIRYNNDLSIVPAGIVGDNTVIGGTGSPIKALARTAKDVLLIGNNAGELFLRNLKDLTEEPFPGKSYATFPGAIYSLTLTSNYNVVIGLDTGMVYVRSLTNGIAGTDITAPVNFGSPIVKLVAMPDPLTAAMTCDDETCYVDFEDFAQLALNWLKCNDPENTNCQ